MRTLVSHLRIWSCPPEAGDDPSRRLLVILSDQHSSESFGLYIIVYLPPMGQNTFASVSLITIDNLNYLAKTFSQKYTLVHMDEDKLVDWFRRSMLSKYRPELRNTEGYLLLMLLADALKHRAFAG